MNEVITPDATNCLIHPLPLGVIHTLHRGGFYCSSSSFSSCWMLATCDKRWAFMDLIAFSPQISPRREERASQWFGRRNRGSKMWRQDLPDCSVSSVYDFFFLFVPNCWEMGEGENGTLMYFINRLNSPHRSTGISSIKNQTLGIHVSQIVVRTLRITIFCFLFYKTRL